MNNLTAKQEIFCKEFVSGEYPGNQSHVYSSQAVLFHQ